jgi:hypothetical protein
MRTSCECADGLCLGKLLFRKDQDVGNGMVTQLVSQTEYNNLQNTLFGYYYRLNTAPSSTTYLRNLNAMETNTTALPPGGQPAASNGTILSPYGATVGDATASQFIIDSAAFATANPGVQTMANTQFLIWYYARWGEQLGLPTELANAMTAYTPQEEKQGYATALISALFYAGRDQTAFDYQLKATSLRWLFTGVWSTPVQATATATIAGGKVTGINPVNQGAGYLAGFSPASVTISGGGGSGATATAVVGPNGQISSFTVTNQGTGYTSVPTVTIGSPTVNTQVLFNSFVSQLLSSSAGVPTWSWVFANGLTGANALPTAAPKGDGIENLLKYAFNLDPNVAYTGPSSIITPTGSAGLPLVNTVNDSGVNYLQITYVRRINENSITYIPEFSSSLTDPVGWQSATEQPEVTPIDSIWERVTVRDSLPQGAAPARFGRVKVTSSFWMP